MPPRYSYWTILAGGLPTAFRAAERADLLPTFNRIRDKHPDAEMKWFARGRLWESPEAAQDDLHRQRARRDRDWRPGGDHRDPRKKFQDSKHKRTGADRDKRRSELPTGPASRSKDRRATAARDGVRRVNKPRGPRPEHPRGPRPEHPRGPRPERRPSRPERPAGPPPKRRR